MKISVDPAVIAPASSGRSRCRACREAIAKGALRLGQRVPNPYGDGEATYWFHLTCATAKCPELVVAALAADETLGQESALRDSGPLRELGIQHVELPGVGDVDRAPTARARCRQCRETIPKHELRVGVSRLQEGLLSPEGFVHLTCARAKFPGPLLEFLKLRGPTLKQSAWDPTIWREVSDTLGDDERDREGSRPDEQALPNRETRPAEDVAVVEGDAD